MSEEKGKLYCWYTTYPDGTEGSVGAMMAGMHGPLACRSERVARTVFRAIAEAHKKSTGQRVWLRIFDSYTDEEPI